MLSKSLNTLEKFDYVNKLLKIKVNVSQYIILFLDHFLRGTFSEICCDLESRVPVKSKIRTTKIGHCSRN